MKVFQWSHWPPERFAPELAGGVAGSGQDAHAAQKYSDRCIWLATPCMASWRAAAQEQVGAHRL
jgi:hypothetical protein